MGNCPTCSAEHVTKSLDPLCQGRRMWTAFLFSSFSILLGGWMLMRICDVIQRLFDRWNSTRHSSGRKKMTRSRRKGRDLYDVDDTVDQASELLNDIKEWDSSLISGKTKLGKTFVRSFVHSRTSSRESFAGHHYFPLQYRFVGALLPRYKIQYVSTRSHHEEVRVMRRAHCLGTWNRARDSSSRSVCRLISVWTWSFSSTFFFAYVSFDLLLCWCDPSAHE